jgi:predicted DNA-binding transcriptional regulator YafY
MDSPTTRVLALLELLQSQGELSGQALAERLDIDARTLRRYVRKLQSLDVPVESVRGRHGLYRLRPGYKLPPLMFTDDEALAVSIGLLFAAGLGVNGPSTGARTAQTKLERVMPKALGDKLQALSNTLQLDVDASNTALHSHALLELSASAHQRTRVWLQYTAANGVLTERELDCYGLAWRAGRWYAVGYCHQRKDLRSFRIDRVQAIQRRPVRFNPPAQFDALQHLALGVASITRAHQITVRLETDMASAGALLFDALGWLAPEGANVLLHSQADDLHWYARQLAHLPCKFQVLEPPALRDALGDVAKHLKRMAQRT